MKAKFMEVAKANLMIVSIAKRGAKLDSDIQNVAMTAILHANTPKDNNADIGIKLVGALTSGQRKASLIVYLCTHGNFEYDKKTKVVKFARKAGVETDPEVLFDKLSANHWTKATPEQDPAAFLDAAKAVSQLVKRIQAEIKDGKGDKIVWGEDSVSKAVKAIVVEGAELNFVTEQ